MKVRKEKPDTCWNCGWEGTDEVDAYRELDDGMWECRRCRHFLDYPINRGE